MIAFTCLVLALSAAPTTAAPPMAPDAVSLVLIVASNRGAQTGRRPLQYADDDGAKYFEVFSTIAGEQNTILLTDFDRDTARLFPELLEKVRSPTRAQLDLAAARLARRSAELRQAGRKVRFHFVFAGHGDVDQGRGFLELADGPFTADDLQALLRNIDASEAHVILDSCNSFFVVNPRKPGGARFATPRDAAEALARRLPNVGVFLSTSAQAEVYEWSELQSGVFSHAVRSGLMGAADANGDGHVSYEELAGFVEIAVADIKNPLFRPTVYARGPNGEDARAILDVPTAARTVLRVDDAGPVRLAARDTDGLRWVDAYKEAGSKLTLWFPSSLTRRLEIDRLKVGAADRGQIDASFELPMGGGAPVNLTSLVPARSIVAMRGPGDIFQALFSRPFGPAALADYLSQRAARVEPALTIQPGLQVPAAAEPDSGPSGSPEPVAAARPRAYAVARPGFTVPWVSGGNGVTRGYNGSASSDVAARIAIAAGAELNAFLAAEIEGAYAQYASSPWSFRYPSQGYTNNPIDATAVRLQMVPIALNLRLQLPVVMPHPYLLAGAGLAPTLLTIDPPDFNATLRATRYVPFFHAGAGLLLYLSERAFVGIEGRFFMTSTIHAFGASIGVKGASGAVLLGTRL